MDRQKFDYRKILIIGCSGAGKSTLAAALGEKLKIPVVNLDKIWWLSNWQHITEEEFDKRLETELNKNCWIIDGNYRRTFSTRIKYADFCLFLDYPADVCLKSAYKRYLEYKGRTRPDMTDGCEEKFDPEFAQWINSYEKTVRPDMISVLKNSAVPYKIFTDRAETLTWLNGLQL